MVKFEKKTKDWWFLTLLPVFLIILLFAVNYLIKGWESSLSSFIEETLIFSIVLSSTDLALRKVGQVNGRSKLAPMYPLFLGIIVLSVYEAAINIIVVKYSNIVYIPVALLAALLAYVSFKLYNDNPSSGFDEPNPVKTRATQEKKDLQEFEPGKKAKGVRR
ncbi:MAG: hypothetical protein KGI06_03120 [Candidatus Micrarchaeota archaeon]|nr:hypothetical protein [Candidatus Micrarchaeota archaeon]